MLELLHVYEEIDSMIRGELAEYLIAHGVGKSGLVVYSWQQVNDTVEVSWANPRESRVLTAVPLKRFTGRWDTGMYDVCAEASYFAKVDSSTTEEQAFHLGRVAAYQGVANMLRKVRGHRKVGLMPAHLPGVLYA